ncbi:ELMO/CED-12 family [Fragilaria crotonensis]|nr:ELMO/CED-12 family [Fragilaria crotonensis]
MVISYDNLVVRLWMHGAIMPFADLLGTPVETYINEDGLPPIPHEYWVERLGFQQPDPVTDFRSGGVLSLAMMVHMVESCLPTVKRFHSPDGDASVLPFGITCINVTDMMAKFLMLAKSTDKMEALMSQKPFWRMFADPNAILALQELSMQMLCNVVVEMNRERCISSSKNNNNTTAAASNSMMPGGSNDNTNRPVSVFDFAEILERTERRVRDDLLGAGPSTVEELRSIAASLATKYQHQLEEKERKAGIHMANMNNNSNRNNPVQNAVAGASNIAGSAVAGASNIAGSAVAGASNIAGSAVAGATNMAAGVFEKIKGAKLPNPLARNQQSNNNTDTVPSPTIVDIPPRDAAVTSQRPMVDLLSGNNEGDTPTIGDDWMGVSKDDFPSYPPTNVTNATTSPPFHFSIDDEEDIL